MSSTNAAPSREMAIEVRALRKVYGVREHAPGLGAAVRQLFTSPVPGAPAVADASFRIDVGERVALVGPEGSGKTTTIKMISGLLYPASGDAKVLGLEPWKERHRLDGLSAAIFGRRSQLWAHHPVDAPLERLARSATREDAARARSRDLLVEAFEIGPSLAKPRRQLSMIEHLRCEAVATLLHAPRLLLLDGLTVGLEPLARGEVRRLVRERAEQEGRTILLTSNDVSDIEIVCDRVIVMVRGSVVLDRQVDSLRTDLLRRKRLTFVTVESTLELALPGVTVEEQSPHRTRVTVDTAITPVHAVVRAARRQTRLEEMRIADPSMGEVVSELCAAADAKSGPSEPRR